MNKVGKMAYTTKKVTFVILDKKEITLRGFWPKLSIEKMLDRIGYKGKVNVFHDLMNYTKPHLTETVHQFSFQHG